MFQRFLIQFTDFIFVEHKMEPSDIIFLPGNSFPQMAEAAAGLWTSGLAPLILPSGHHSVLEENFQGVRDRTGRYSGCFPTEWDFMKHILHLHGIPDSAVLMENTATFTYENALRSRELTDRMKIQIHKAIICCNSYHARRCLLYYQLLYPETELRVYPVDTGINKSNWYQTNKGIDIVLGEIERCGGQFHDILKNL